MRSSAPIFLERERVLIAWVVLHIIETRYRLRCPREGRMRGDIIDPFIPDIYNPSVSETFQMLLTGFIMSLLPPLSCVEYNLPCFSPATPYLFCRLPLPTSYPRWIQTDQQRHQGQKSCRLKPSKDHH